MFRRLLRLEPRAVFVTAIWAALLLAGVAYALRFAANVPYWDDFELVGPMTGETAVTPAVLWEQVSGHRRPLPRAICLLVLSLSSRGFEWIPVLNFVAIGAGTLLALSALWRTRGPRYTDAVLPLAVMSLGPAVSLLRATLVTGGTFLFVMMAAFALLLRMRREPHREPVVGMAAVCLVLSLVNTTAIAMMAPLAAWTVWRLVRSARGAAPPLTLPRQAAAWLLLGGAAASMLLVAGGVSGAPGQRATLDGALAVSLQALGQSFGPAGAVGWAGTGFGGIRLPAISLAAAIGTLLAVALLVRAARRRPAQRVVLLGLLAVCTGHLLQAAAIGGARASFREDWGLQNHYIPFFSTLLPAVYLAADATLRPRWRRLWQMALFTALCALVTFNVQVAFRQGKERQQGIRAFETDAAAGLTSDELARKYVPFLYPGPERLRGYLETMRRHRLHPFED